MTKCIVWKRPDGGVSTTHVVEPRIDEESEAEYFTRIEAKLRETHIGQDGNMYPTIPSDWVNVGIVDPATLPAREWRNAWGHDGSAVNVPIGRAREVTKERLRREREPLLPNGGMGPADLALRDAMLAKDDASIAAAQAELKRLRDVTKLADAANSLAALSQLRVAA